MITVAPAIRQPHKPNWDSLAAWTSFTLAAEPPAQRQGSPSSLASWPAASEALKCSGVPKAGAPDFMSTLDVNVP